MVTMNVDVALDPLSTGASTSPPVVEVAEVPLVLGPELVPEDIEEAEPLPAEVVPAVVPLPTPVVPELAVVPLPAAIVVVTVVVTVRVVVVGT